jgi:uncharacterized protein (DUF58 family)
MLTSRGWWFLLFVFALLLTGLIGQFVVSYFLPTERIHLANPLSIVLVGLTLLSWFCAEWLLFAVRLGRMRRGAQVARAVGDDRGPIEALWAGRTFLVRVQVVWPDGLRMPYAAVTERIPFGVEFVKGETRFEGPVEENRPTEMNYMIRCPATGRIRFEGLRVQIADLQGFFYHETFLPAVAEFRVLPPLADIRGRSPTVKRTNLLPPPGHHRHRRAGTGSELLDLRDYLPGDPPKTIAWKVSARRDRLITKEFESEVPLRLTLFVDTSNSVRVGPPGQNALAGLVQVAAAVAQASAGTRDLTGLCLFDEHHATAVRPARGARHLAQLLNMLTDASGLAPTVGEAPLEGLTRLAHGFAEEVCPELMRSDINRVPYWMPWLLPKPAYTIRDRQPTDRLYRLLPVLLPIYWIGGLVFVAAAYLALISLLDGLQLPLYYSLPLIAILGFALPLIFLRVPPALFFSKRRQQMRWRKQLAAVLSVHYGLQPGGLARLLEDDDYFSRHVQRFLAEHHVPYDLPLYDRHGAYLFATPAKVRILADALVRAVGRGRDNELFVLLADLLELPEALDPLLRAVKVALARHHRVVVVCPWPPGIAAPRTRDAELPGQVSSVETGAKASLGVRAMLETATTARFHRAFYDLRRTFGRVGVPVTCAQSGDSPRLILDRMELLRGLGRKR